MKKSLLLGFAAAMTLASCTTNDEVLDAAAQTAMEFGAFVNKSTKAPITNDNITGSKFAVWGYKYKTGITDATPTNVFLNIPVSYQGTAWSYTSETEKLRYWDKTCTYDFYAYAPSSVDAAISNVAQEAATITVTNFEVSNTAYTGHTDLMIATAIPGTTTYGTQSFTFNHKLTKVNMQIKKATTLNADVVKLVSATFTGVVNKATLRCPFGTTGTEGWTLSDQTADFAAVLPTDGVVTTTAASIFTDLLMIPQSITATQFEISYTINGEPFSKTLDLASTWAINQSYLYTLTIDADAIQFSATVAEWVEQPENGTTVKDQN